MPPEEEAKCPVDSATRDKWLAAAKAAGKPIPPHPPISSSSTSTPSASLRFSLDSGTWQPLHTTTPTPASSQPRPPKMYRLSTDREISTIPRAVHDPNLLNSAERAALPSNAQEETGLDASGNWIYPSQHQFFNAMQRKGHPADPADMASIVPIHNAVNERAWASIKQWEAERGEANPKLVSFSGDSKALTPKAWWLGLMGYTKPFDRHDWVVEGEGGRRVEYVIDFYKGKDDEGGKGLAFYLDARPKVNTWEGVWMRGRRWVGL